MKLFKNQQGFNDVIVMMIIGGIVGAIFITGVFIWQEINFQQEQMKLLNIANKIFVTDNETQIVKEQNEDPVENIVLNILDIPNFEGSISFSKPSNYKADNFVLETSESDDLEYGTNEYRLNLLEYRYGDSMSKAELEEYVDKYEEYRQSDFVEYKVSLFLEDEVGKDEAVRWYLTDNYMDMTTEELAYWNYCEAGCQLWPKKILGNYIVWINDLFTGTGAGDSCNSPSGKPTYEELDRQAKCEIMNDFNFLSDIDIL